MSATTLSARKALEAARRANAAAEVVEQLRTYARSKVGRFVVFGSFVDRRMRFDSDLDVLVDFPETEAPAAWDFVEDACSRARLDPDIHDASTSKAAFVARIMSKGVVLA